MLLSVNRACGHVSLSLNRRGGCISGYRRPPIEVTSEASLCHLPKLANTGWSREMVISDRLYLRFPLIRIRDVVAFVNVLDALAANVVIRLALSSFTEANPTWYQAL